MLQIHQIKESKCSPVLRCEGAGMLVNRCTGHNERWAVALDWLLRRPCTPPYRLPWVHWMPSWSWIGYMRVGRGNPLTQWVCSCCTGGTTRRDRCWCGSFWLEPRCGFPVTGTVNKTTHGQNTCDDTGRVKTLQRRHKPVAVKALLSEGHGTPVLATRWQVFGGSGFSFDLDWRGPMKHYCVARDKENDW